MKPCKLLLVISGLASMLAATVAAAPTLSFKFTKASVPGALATSPGGINNDGVIVGEYEDKSTVVHCFMMVGGKVTTINYPKVASDSCVHINSAGAIVGAAKISATVSKGFVYQNGEFTNIPGPKGAISSVAYGINDSGVIVGTYSVTLTKPQAFLLKGKTYTTIDPPGTTSFAIATAINNEGDVVIAYGTSTGIQSALYNGKTYKTINVPGAANSFASDINSAGDITYETLNSTGQKATGYLYLAGKFYPVNYPKSADSSVTGLNDKSDLVGYYHTTSVMGPELGFKATY
jgi:uncharacterized membrane protein